MAERRRLVDGLTRIPTPEEQAFIEGRLVTPESSTETKPVIATTAAPIHGNSPLSTRIRSDLATALKRASLERQLSGEEPNSVKDILEDAIEPWLRSHGYLD
jgi:hypothetical protein